MKDPGEIFLFQAEDGGTRIDVRLVGESVWLTATQMAELFQRDKSTISRHIQNVYEEGELSPAATVANFATVQWESGATERPFRRRGLVIKALRKPIRPKGANYPSPGCNPGYPENKNMRPERAR